MLEAELATICPIEGQLSQNYRSNQEQDLHKLRLLLERECAAQVCTPMCAQLHMSMPKLDYSAVTAVLLISPRQCGH